MIGGPKSEKAWSTLFTHKLSRLPLKSGVIVAVLPHEHPRFRHREMEFSGEVGDFACVFHELWFASL
ncbi:hypothetical protein EN852_019510 [Mesorhizobium sp. M2E.F.Ca.ET.209.01.1.1]|uniref:hypothetical protein n=1 Tax=Mesorhizobium sp. M2E.F.Ca.ET.209.01.1.1 TaxID=2500526 RepID=UPI000FD9E026|nr:hypothetical protein [Mesorhizobium sp. M2E.F.Ca.ET.209.01.1.1]TGS12386.1 hypothetical protein EN852_019510 [Mesorhizobium sp. M2E.F.Ca.ET.209.01.1.1]